MAAQKTSNIDDIKRPDKVTPSTTARPIVVTNHPTMTNDPMMAPTDDKKDESTAEQPMNHSAKSIKPLDASLATSAAEPAATAPEETGTPNATESPNPSAQAPAESTPAKPAVSPSPAEAPVSSGAEVSDVERDGEAAISAEEAAAAEAKAKREEELETLIASGKYAVPINAVQRKRSRMATLLLCVLTVLLAVVLVDAVADVGILKLPTAVPHTHFFSAK